MIRDIRKEIRQQIKQELYLYDDYNGYNPIEINKIVLTGIHFRNLKP